MYWPSRDTKQGPDGPILAFPQADFAAFLTAIKAGEFDHLTS